MPDRVALPLLNSERIGIDEHNEFRFRMTAPAGSHFDCKSFANPLLCASFARRRSLEAHGVPSDAEPPEIPEYELLMAGVFYEQDDLRWLRHYSHPRAINSAA